MSTLTHESKVTKKKGTSLVYPLIIVSIVLLIGLAVVRTPGAIEDGFGYISFIFFADIIFSFWSTPIAIDYYNFSSYQPDVIHYLQNAFAYIIPSIFLKIFTTFEKIPYHDFMQRLDDAYEHGLGFSLATNIISEAYITGGLAFCFVSPIIIASTLRLIEKLTLYRSVAGYMCLAFLCSNARLIVRENFYILFFSFVGIMMFLGSWIFLLQPSNKFTKPHHLPS
jgi:hypothetical protein